MKFIKLTSLNGTEFNINVDHISYYAHEDAPLYSPEKLYVAVHISNGDKRILVQESLQELNKLIYPTKEHKTSPIELSLPVEDDNENSIGSFFLSEGLNYQGPY